MLTASDDRCGSIRPGDLHERSASPQRGTSERSSNIDACARMYGPAARCKTDFQERRTWELHQCIRSLSGANFAPDHHGYPRASRLTTGKTSVGHYGTQSRGCAGQTVRPSLHSISQTSVGKQSILMYSVLHLPFDFDVARIR